MMSAAGRADSREAGWGVKPSFWNIPRAVVPSGPDQSPTTWACSS